MDGALYAGGAAVKVPRQAQELLCVALEAAWDLDSPKVGAVIGQLAGVTAVELVDDDGTACISRAGERYQISFSRRFLRDWIQSPQDLLFVLLHELMHKVRGDLLRSGVDWGDPYQRYCANVVADALINSSLQARFFRNGIDLLSRMYRDGRGIAALLYPPIALARELIRNRVKVPGLRSAETVSDVRRFARRLWIARAAAEGEVDERNQTLADVYEALWEQRTSFHCAYETLLCLHEDVEQLLFLGGHDPVDEEGWPREMTDYWSGMLAGFSRSMDTNTINVAKAQRQAKKISHQLMRALDPDYASPMQRPGFVVERSVIPGPGRRSGFLLSSGVWPGFFENVQYETTTDDRRVHLYLDVSGSTKSLQPFLYGLVLELDELVGEQIYLFSNQVVEISLKDLAEGRCETTGGTDFNCVIEHAVRSDFRRIVVVTDGLASADSVRCALASRHGLEAWLLLNLIRKHMRTMEQWVRQVWDLGPILRELDRSA